MAKQRFYAPKQHIDNLIITPYYKNLISLRNTIGLACDSFFQKKNAPKIDLPLISKGISSPMGKGSDSLSIPFQFGDNPAFLADSAQFGMEPLVCTAFKMVYCYLPSFRGEGYDDRHLNQFYHCEGELRGTYTDVISLVNELVKHLVSEVIKGMENNVYEFDTHNFESIKNIIVQEFPTVTFDEADKLLTDHKLGHLIERTSYGRIISRDAELTVVKLISNNKLPIWITKYDIDVVPFYQKPDPENPAKVLNADLIFPSINGGFGGEMVGSGQRQDTAEELQAAFKRQGIKHVESYDWYVKLRKHPNYTTTSGFGLGIERFIAWMLGLPSIIDASIYPVLKNEILI